ncbi:hypothetical protein CHCC5022_2750 [Bacillus paralicheniformis]|nr:hypothetical protein CHCC5022_2750 [Bacillus paralicheniformis]
MNELSHQVIVQFFKPKKSLIFRFDVNFDLPVQSFGSLF